MVWCNCLCIEKTFCSFMHFIHSVLSLILTKNICLFTAKGFVNIALKEPVNFYMNPLVQEKKGDWKRGIALQTP